MPLKYGKQECRIISLIVKGYKWVEIAEELKICEKTVFNHIENIRNKCGLTKRKDLQEFFKLNDWQLINAVSLETELEIIKHCKKHGVGSRGNNQPEMIHFIAEKFGASDWRVREIVKKYRGRKFAIISEAPKHECFKVQFGKIINA